jgi:thiamine biosynthesis lipoprotein
MARKKKNIGIIILSLMVLIIFTACTKNEEPMTKEEIIFGSIPVKITIFDSSKEEELDVAFELIKAVDNKMSKNKDESEISAINLKAGKEYVPVSKETFDIIQKSESFYKTSKGYFDITIGPLVELWDIGPTTGHIPEEGEIEMVLDLINYDNIEFNESNHEIKLSKENMVIDLGGIAKGYAADVVVDYFRSAGIKKAIINLGGNVSVMGQKNEEDLWAVGIQNPLEPTGSSLGILKAADISVVTSGTYQRYFEENGVRYHHILDPKNGYPIRNNLQSVTIVTENSLRADALSTALFALGLEEGLSLANNDESIEAIFVTKENKIYLSEGIKNNFKLLRNNFEIVE